MEIKLIALADMHLRETPFDCRVPEENWMDTVEAKLNYIKTTVADTEADGVLIAGDIFDYWRVQTETDVTQKVYAGRHSPKFLAYLMRKFVEIKASTRRNRIYTIPGNHDSAGGDIAELERTPYALFRDAGIFTDIGSAEKLPFAAYHYQQVGLLESRCPVVVAHKGLYLIDKPYPEAPDDGNVDWFVNHCIDKRCMLVVAGDYHKPFAVKINEVLVINCGSMFRMRADQMDYKPVLWEIVLNTEERTVDCTKHPFELKYEISRKHIDAKKEQTDMCEEVIGSISGDFEITLDFTKNFLKLISHLPNKKAIHTKFEEIKA